MINKQHNKFLNLHKVYYIQEFIHFSYTLTPNNEQTVNNNNYNCHAADPPYIPSIFPQPPQ